MINVYNFLNYTPYLVYSRVLHRVEERNIPLFRAFNTNPYYTNFIDLIIPIPNTIPYSINDGYWTTNKISYSTSDKNLLVDKSKLFIHPNCTIPRAKVTQKYSRVIKKEKADFCVIPQSIVNLENIKGVLGAIFVNEDKQQVFVIKSDHYWENHKYSIYTTEMCQNAPLGSTILDIIPDLINVTFDGINTVKKQFTINQDVWGDFLQSKLVFSGSLINLTPKEMYVGDLIYNKLHNILSEKDILESITNMDNVFNLDVYKSMVEMFKSQEPSLVGLALKTVAELDYIKYKNSISSLLSVYFKYWAGNPMQNTVSVKHMLDYLNIRNSMFRYYSNTIESEDFALMSMIIKQELQNSINEQLTEFTRTYPFADINISYDINVLRKETKDEIL